MPRWLAQIVHVLHEVFVFRYKGKPSERMGRKATCLGSQDDGRGAAEGALGFRKDRLAYAQRWCAIP
jgi:hypothetical protein